MAEDPAPFDFKRHLIKVQGGRTYLPVSARIIWFRQEHPDWSIETEAVEINHEKQYAVFRARICNADGKLMATGTKKEDVKGFGDYIEKSETGAVGRALALCGFGTQFAPELDESGRAPSRYGGSSQGQVGGSHPAAQPASGFRRPAPAARIDGDDNGEDDPFADDPSPTQETTAPAPGATPACVECGKALTKAQSELSIRHYGEALCPADQKGKPRN